MTIEELQAAILEIKQCYRDANARNGTKEWSARDYADRLLVDVAALVRPVLARHHLRSGESSNERIAHELGDIVWSAFVIADELGMDLAHALPAEMVALRARFD